jgi:ankyrin repeat protein
MAQMWKQQGRHGEKPLHQVSYNGKYKSQGGWCTCRTATLDRGADVNTRCKDDQTPLHLASYYGNVEIVRLLLDYGAEANVDDKYGEKPLHKVAWNECKFQEDCVRVAQLLLEYGADVNRRNKNSWPPLHFASFLGRIEIVHVLLDLHTRRKDSWTPLHLGSYFGRVEVVRLLIHHGAEVNAEDEYGEKPLHIVARASSAMQISRRTVSVSAQLLLEHGADLQHTTQGLLDTITSWILLWEGRDCATSYPPWRRCERGG